MKSSKGFALVLSMSLMALIFLLLLSLTSFTQVETLTIDQRLIKETARKNAKLGLKIALSQLQQHAGPDQRVTARSDIMEEHDFDFEFDRESIQNPFYTMVWDVSGAEDISDYATELEPQHDTELKPRVLVSGNEYLEPDDTNYISHITQIDSTDDDSVLIVGSEDKYSNHAKYNSYDEELVDVHVKRVPINTRDSMGSYAWWIGDEGIKSRINLAHRDIENSDEMDHYEWMTMHRHGTQLFPEVNEEILPRVFSLNTVPMLIAENEEFDQGEFNEKIHDFTVDSKSVLTNVKKGRLKRDLTYALDEENGSPSGEASVTDDKNYLIDDELTVSSSWKQRASNLNYTRWGVLRDYYNLRAEGDSIEAGPHLLSQSTLNKGELDFDTITEMGIQPIITQFQWGWYVRSNGERRAKAEVLHKPAVVLWNPYSVNMSCPKMLLSFTKSGGGGINENKVAFEISGVRFEMNQLGFTIPPTEIPAGEAIIFSPRNGVRPYDEPYSSRTTNKDVYNNLNGNELEQGWNAGGAFLQKTDISIRGKFIKLKQEKDTRFGMVSLYFVDNHSNAIEERAALICGLTGGRSEGYDEEVEYPVNADGSNNEPVYLYSYTMNFSDTESSFISERHPPFPLSWMGQFNPRATFHNAPWDDIVGKDRSRCFAYTGGYITDPNGSPLVYPSIDGDNAFVGNSTTVASGATKAIYYDIPEGPLTSLAQLSHANITGVADGHVRGVEHWKDGKKYGIRGVQLDGFESHRSSDHFSPAYAIGSGLGAPFVPLDDVSHYAQGSGNAFMHVWDYSYLLNDKLFDDYFFSTIPQGSEKIDKNKALPNPILKIDVNAEDEDLKDFTKAAASLTLVGGFNINSTSVNAWASFLGAFRGVPVDGQSTDESTPYSRVSRPVGEVLAYDDIDMLDSMVNTGVRALSDEELQDMAERIVEQVKLRGPFPSMSAFVNRVIYTDKLYKQESLSDSVSSDYDIYSNLDVRKSVMSASALETALARCEANKPFYSDRDFIAKENKKALNMGGAVGTHLPGYISQVDILSKLGSAMNVRSDTFKIRAYGDTSGAINLTARCEAIVQRDVSYFDKDSNDAWDPVLDLNKDNEKYGRRFKIVSFRWLDDDEI